MTTIISIAIGLIIGLALIFGVIKAGVIIVAWFSNLFAQALIFIILMVAIFGSAVLIGSVSH